MRCCFMVIVTKQNVCLIKALNGLEKAMFVFTLKIGYIYFVKAVNRSAKRARFRCLLLLSKERIQRIYLFEDGKCAIQHLCCINKLTMIKRPIKKGANVSFPIRKWLHFWKSAHFAIFEDLA